MEQQQMRWVRAWRRTVCLLQEQRRQEQQREKRRAHVVWGQAMRVLREQGVRRMVHGVWEEGVWSGRRARVVWRVVHRLREQGEQRRMEQEVWSGRKTRVVWG